MWLESNLSGLLHLDENFLDGEPTLYGKADIVRGAILYQHGGLYIDADTLWVNGQCLDDILTVSSTTGFFAAIEPAGSEGACQGHVANGVMGAIKHHPVVLEYMHVQQVFQITKGPGTNAWERLGPLALSAALETANNFECETQRDSRSFHATNSSVSLVTILHPKYFYPISWHGVSQSLISNTSSLHGMLASQYPDAVMFQIGLSTNLLQVDM